MKYISRSLRLAVMFLFGQFLATAAHEMGHVIAVKILGGEGKVLYHFYYYYLVPSGDMEWTTMPEYNLWIVYLAGGLFAALLFFPFWLEAWLSPTRQDMYIEAVMASLIIFELLSVPAELILYALNKQLYQLAFSGAQIFTSIIFMILYIKKIADWIDKTCNWKDRLCNY